MEWKYLEAGFAALYLPGLERGFEVSVRDATGVEAVGRRHPSAWAEALADAGFYAESLLLQDANLMDQAFSLLHEGRVLTSLSQGYPPLWGPRLAQAAPPALWLHGGCSLAAGPAVGIVGGREAGPVALRFARESASEAADSGFSLVSGFAKGVDQSARAGGQGFDVLPYGMELRPAKCLSAVSACKPWDVFSVANAMTRNTLIYAASEITLVVEPRYKEGGSWHGAVAALRRKWPVAVYEDGSTAAKALTALGAMPVKTPFGFLEACKEVQESRTVTLRSA